MNKIIILLILLITAMISIVAAPVPASMKREVLTGSSPVLTNQSIQEHRDELSEMVTKNKYLIVLMQAYVSILLVVFVSMITESFGIKIIRLAMLGGMIRIVAQLQFYRALTSFFTGLGWR